MTTTQLFDQLATEGGAIVCSADCSPMEIAVAQSCGRFAIDENNLGYVRRPKEWLAVAKRREEAHPNTDGRFDPPKTVADATGLREGPCLDLAKQLYAEGHTQLPPGLK